MTEISSQERDYLPGLGKHYLMPLYDVVHRVAGLHGVHQQMITVAGLRAGHRVLDVGCGTGNLLRSTGKRHRDVELFGVDPDLKMLARAERKIRRAGLRARLDRGYAQELAFPDDSFDRVFSSLMLHHLDTPSKDEMLAEVRRVLRPDGLLVLADAVLHDHSREHLRDNVGDAVAKRIAAAGFTVEPTRRRKLRMFGEVGIEVARVH
ncbi:ubiquinone/menaquinone biosynthesis C-methylase UbiE [Lentzea atacamensis]|uniref:Ubiquinone/menaquinone biosynthesis C-methylase UbiE n=2 Tax=Lentzea TaxID=165301 RepID=A0A316I1M9_9PSEU|nr:class I SAM-dependent methyltransferase [Lentzea atacamensis]PWK87045.1 ubiquinone/menaquinone biosynthesis C-methylase UbiE [Lentzea atacamensis]RAS70247.1 ubiquinone/menaquinone biosynthesis C-methylase UbiE [Lentzea atacamensis]